MSADITGSERRGLTSEQVALLRQTKLRGVTDDEAALFVAVCNRTGLDPFTNQIYAVKRYDSNLKRDAMSIQVSIDGMRSLAEDTHHYAGQLGPYWCGMDGQWVEVWLKTEPPAAAKVGVLRNDWKETLWAVARWDSYVQRTKDGNPTRFWAQMPDHMLAKCVESIALRRAFPAKLSGLYTAEEMGQPENPERIATKQAAAVNTQTGEITQAEDGEPIAVHIDYHNGQAAKTVVLPAAARPTAPPAAQAAKGIPANAPIGSQRAKVLADLLRKTLTLRGLTEQQVDTWINQQLQHLHIPDLTRATESQGKDLVARSEQTDPPDELEPDFDELEAADEEEEEVQQ